MEGFPSRELAIAVLCFVGFLLALAYLGAMAEATGKAIRKVSHYWHERARLRWVEQIKQPKDVEPV